MHSSTCPGAQCDAGQEPTKAASILRAPSLGTRGANERCTIGVFRDRVSDTRYMEQLAFDLSEVPQWMGSLCDTRY